MTESHDSHEQDRRRALEDFVYGLLCARARRALQPLDGATLRGLVARCGLRPSDLRQIHEHPMVLLNGVGDNGADFSRANTLFMGAMARHGAEVDEGGRPAFVALMADVVRTLSTETAFDARSVPLPPHGPLRKTVRDVLISAGLRVSPRGAIAALERVLPTLSEPPRVAACPAQAPPVPPVSLPGLPGMSPIFTRARRPAVRAALLLLAPVLSPMPPFAISSGSPVTAPEPPEPGARPQAARPVALRDAVPSRSGTILLERIARHQRRRRRLAFVVGLGGSLIGFPLLLEGLVAESPWAVAIGAAIVVGALSADYWIARVVHRAV